MECVQELNPGAEDPTMNDQFREMMFSSMIDAMAILVETGYFSQHSIAEDTLIQIAVSDSEDDDRLMDLSIQKLNPPSVYESFLQQKAEGGY